MYIFPMFFSTSFQFNIFDFQSFFRFVSDLREIRRQAAVRPAAAISGKKRKYLPVSG
jgi:hypothetical protein